jgi:hypothetical protein
MSDKSRDGIMSCLAFYTGGTWDSPTGLTVLEEATDNFDIPDNYDKTPLKGRHTRDGNRFIRGARHLADEMEINFEWDAGSTLHQFLMSAKEANDTVIAVWSPYFDDPTTPVLPADEYVIKVEYKIFSLDRNESPGSPQGRKMQLAQFKGARVLKILND